MIDLNNKKLKEMSNFMCPYKYSTDDLIEYNKVRDSYVQNRRVMKTIYKQASYLRRHLSLRSL